MSAQSQHQQSSLLMLLELVTCVAGFALVAAIYGLTPQGQSLPVWSDEQMIGLGVAAVTFWLAMPFWERASSDALRSWIEQFFTALGFILIVQSGLAYFFLLSPVPWWLVLAGTIAAIGLMAWLRSLLYPKLDSSSGMLLFGFDEVAAAVAPALGGELTGVVEDEVENAPPDYAYLGKPSQLEAVMTAARPAGIMVSAELSRRPPSARTLLKMRYSGTPIVNSMSVYETRLGRVRWMQLQPEQLLFSSPLSATRSVMALQAIYANLIGLALLLALSPVMAVCALAVALFTNGPVIEYTESAGFQRIPFQRRRFRTRGRDGKLTGVGRFLVRWRLSNLPQLINIVRGEMSLFGPPPSRREFADRICELIPMYSQRFLVKPGILGWAQVNMRGTETSTDELLRLEYDLYYVNRGSPSLDLEIIIRTLLQWPYSPYGSGTIRKTAGAAK